jgi:hypothetical protein
MEDNQQGRVKLWWARYKRWFFILLAVYLAVLVAFFFLAGGPQREPFLYQLF